MYKQKKYNKYKNKKIKVAGREFDSKREANRYCELIMLQKAKVISDLQCQVKYELLPKQKGERAMYYIADFMYTENGKTIVEDVKGYLTEVYRIKRKLFKYRYPDIDFREVR